MAVIFGASACSDSASPNNEFGSVVSDEDMSSDISGSTPSDDINVAAKKVCDEATRQLTTIPGGSGIQIRQCSAQSDSGYVGWVLALNDYVEWSELTATRSMEEVIFRIPLGLVAYAFAGSDVEPETFDQILIVFNDIDQTVYDFPAAEITDVLTAQTQDEATAKLISLQSRMRITTIK
jgi:hypothetical protein